MQAYFTRKLGIQGAEIDEPGPFITQKVQLTESESDPIFATPTLNWSHDSARSKPLVPTVTFLDPLSETDQQTEIEQPRNTTKRPRVGSCSIVDIQPPPKFGLLSSYLNIQVIHTSSRHPSSTHLQISVVIWRGTIATGWAMGMCR